MLITIAVAAGVRDGLAAYGTILRYGQHEKMLTACFSGASIEYALMEGVVAGLRAVNRPSEIAVITDLDIFPACLQATPFEHLRETADALENTHKISWRTDPEFPDLPRCSELVTDSLAKYLEACTLASPALPFFRLVTKIYGLPDAVQVFFQKRSITLDGEVVEDEPVAVNLDRIRN